MAPKYVLHYFDGRGRAEAIRWIFAYAGVNFEDHRFPLEQWPAIKPTAPGGQVPWLDVDGKPLTQSMAIARFVARQHGLTGKDDFEAAQADALVDYVQDGAKGLLAIFQEQHDQKKVALKEKCICDAQQVLKGLEMKLQSNNKGEGFFVGSKPTWADFLITVFLDCLVDTNNSTLDSYPCLKAHRQRVHDLKGIKEWLLKRPTTGLWSNSFFV